MKVATHLIPLAFPVALLVTWPAFAGVKVGVDETLGGLAGPGAGGTVGEVGTKAKGDGLPGAQSGCFVNVNNETVAVVVEDLATGACRITADADGDEVKGTSLGTPDADGGMSSSDATFSDAGRSFRVYAGVLEEQNSDGTWTGLTGC